MWSGQGLGGWRRKEWREAGTQTCPAVYSCPDLPQCTLVHRVGPQNPECLLSPLYLFQKRAHSLNQWSLTHWLTSSKAVFLPPEPQRVRRGQGQASGMGPGAEPWRMGDHAGFRLPEEMNGVSKGGCQAWSAWGWAGLYPTFHGLLFLLKSNLHGGSELPPFVIQQT